MYRIVSRCLTGVALLAALLSHAGALELPDGDPPPWLDRELRPNWRLEPLGNALAVMAAEIDAPMDRSAEVEDLIDRAIPVVMIEDQLRPLGDLLRVLETTHDLHFRAEPLRLVVMTHDEWLESQREPMQLDLRDYGLNVPMFLDFPGDDLGFGNQGRDGRGGGGFALFGGGDIGNEPAIEPEDILDWLEELSGDDHQLRLRHGGLILGWATAEEAEQLHGLLSDAYERRIQRSTWQVTFALAARDERLPTGIVSADAARDVVAVARAQRTLTLTVMDGQLGNTRASRDLQLVLGADVVVAGNGTGSLDPRVRLVQTGHQMELRVTRGVRARRLHVDLDWVEPTSAVERLPVHVPANSGTTSQTTVDQATIADDAEGVVNVTITSDSPIVVHQTAYTLMVSELSLWEWTPRGDVFLLPGQALVLSAPHHSGQQALMILQEVQP